MIVHHEVVEQFDTTLKTQDQDQARAMRAAAEKARMLGAPGQARVTQGYDPNYLIDFVKVEWVTPVLGAQQPPDIYAGEGIVKEKISRRLGEIPR